MGDASYPVFMRGFAILRGTQERHILQVLRGPRNRLLIPILLLAGFLCPIPVSQKETINLQLLQSSHSKIPERFLCSKLIDLSTALSGLGLVISDNFGV